MMFWLPYFVQARHQSSSAAVFPQGHPWTDARKLIWKPAEEHSQSFSNSASQMLDSILHHDGHGELHDSP